MSKGIKYTSTHFNTPPKNIIKQTKENHNYAITRTSNEKMKTPKRRNNIWKKHVNIYDKKWTPKWKNDKITKSLISRVRLAEIFIRLGSVPLCRRLSGLGGGWASWRCTTPGTPSPGCFRPQPWRCLGRWHPGQPQPLRCSAREPGTGEAWSAWPSMQRHARPSPGPPGRHPASGTCSGQRWPAECLAGPSPGTCNGTRHRLTCDRRPQRWTWPATPTEGEWWGTHLWPCWCPALHSWRSFAGPAPRAAGNTPGPPWRRRWSASIPRSSRRLRKDRRRPLPGSWRPSCLRDSRGQPDGPGPRHV